MGLALLSFPSDYIPLSGSLLISFPLYDHQIDGNVTRTMATMLVLVDSLDGGYIQSISL
jgi:hypothetical protein